MKRFLRILEIIAIATVTAIVALLIYAVVTDDPRAPCREFATCPGGRNNLP